jgi:octaprenyl-diphosphate synthase
MMMWLMIVTVVEVFSINALWKNKIAVLVGDLLSKDCCFLLIIAISIYSYISVAVREMSEGELLKIEKPEDLISQKTFITKSFEKRLLHLLLLVVHLAHNLSLKM